MTQMAEEANVLPPEQLGKRAGRSTELAARYVTETVRAAGSERLSCSLLQVDLAGAFDNVHHGWLMTTMEDQGWPQWMRNWVNSFLDGQEATLSFDDWEPPVFRVPAGVPQGSPLFPLLFILFTVSLFEELRETKGISTIGFADDTNLVAVGRKSSDCCDALKDGWDVCDAWAKRRGITFGPDKSTLLHFSQTRAPITETLNLSGRETKPAEETSITLRHLRSKM